MSKEKIGDQHPIQKTINKAQRSLTTFGNLFAHDEGIDDEYFINEIIGIEELPYEEFIKEKDEPVLPPHLQKVQDFIDCKEAKDAEDNEK